MKIFIYLSALSFLFLSACKLENKKKEVADETKTEMTEVLDNVQSKLTGITHVVDVENSTILWKGFKPTGTHDGTLSLKSGEVVLKEGVMEQAYFEMDMASIVNKDMADDDPYKQKLIDHLNSPDFFDTAQFPMASFELKSQATEGDQLNLTGDLTIKGITKSVTFPASVTEEGGSLMLTSSTFKVNRTDFGIKYKSKNFFKDLKDKFINDEFEVSFNMALKGK